MNRSISYIIPIFNTSLEKFVRCVLSIESFNDKNNIKDYEIIIINDGSIEDLSKKYETFIKNKKNIIYIRNKNNGVSFSRNQGINISTKEYISFVDSDDFLIDKKIMENIFDLNSDLIISDIYVITKNKVLSYNFNNGVILWKNALVDHIINATFANPVAKFYKREFLLENNILFNCKYVQGEDNFFNMEVLGFKPTIYYYKNPIYTYEFYVSSTHKRINKNFDSIVEYIENIHEKRIKLIEKFGLNRQKKIYKKIDNKLITTCFSIYINILELNDKEKVKRINEIISKNKINIFDLKLKQKLYYLLIKHHNNYMSLFLKAIKKIKEGRK